MDFMTYTSIGESSYILVAPELQFGLLCSSGPELYTGYSHGRRLHLKLRNAELTDSLLTQVQASTVNCIVVFRNGLFQVWHLFLKPFTVWVIGIWNLEYVKSELYVMLKTALLFML